MNSYDRIGRALRLLTAWHDDFFGIGGAAGDADEYQEAALETVADTLDRIVIAYGLDKIYGEG